jgi:formate C-acetyltransferase
MIEEAGQRAQAEKDETRRNFYLALTHGMEGIIAYSRNLAREARRLAEHETDATERRELLALVDIHDHVPEHPARNFREGLTTIWMCWVALHLENANVGLSLGRLDQLLYPLYRRDIESGTLDVGFAIELLCCLWLKIATTSPPCPMPANSSSAAPARIRPSPSAVSTSMATTPSTT